MLFYFWMLNLDEVRNTVDLSSIVNAWLLLKKTVPSTRNATDNNISTIARSPQPPVNDTNDFNLNAPATSCFLVEETCKQSQLGCDTRSRYSTASKAGLNRPHKIIARESYV